MDTKLLFLALSLVACTESAPEATSQKASKDETANATAPAPAPADEKENDDLRVIPPEIVSGGYLTCEEMEDEKPPKGYERYACNAFSKDGKKANLTGLKQTWKITDTDAEKVDSKRVEGSSASKDHCVWDVAKRDAGNGMKAQVLLEGKGGKSVTLKTKGQF